MCFSLDTILRYLPTFTIATLWVSQASRNIVSWIKAHRGVHRYFRYASGLLVLIVISATSIYTIDAIDDLLDDETTGEMEEFTEAPDGT